MTIETPALTLDEVRTRFLAAEESLGEAARAVAAIQGAAGQIAAARDGLAMSSTKIGELAASLSDLGAGLGENAVALREGVDAIRLGDPAELRRLIQELDAAFTAFQASVGERLEVIEQTESAASQQVRSLARRQLVETRVGLAALALLVFLAIVVSFVVR